MTYEEIMKHEYIWVFMYGHPTSVVSYGWLNKVVEEQNELVKMSTSEIVWSKDHTMFYRFWGWPGPDANEYYVSDYKKTWCLSPEEIPGAKCVLEVKPCKLCGFMPFEVKQPNDDFDIICNRCNVGIKGCKSSNEAIEAWNKLQISNMENYYE